MAGMYEKNTTVGPEQTLSEIKATLKRYKATGFGYFEDQQRAGIAFEMKGRRVRFVMPLPQEDDYPVNQNKGIFSPKQSQQAYEKALRQRWRALLLTIKAKLESVERGIEAFEEAFMAQLVLPDGHTMAEWAIPQIKSAYSTGEMPPLLGSGK